MRPTERHFSFELEALDQLVGGDLSLAVIRQVFPDDGAFLQGVADLLGAGDVALVVEGIAVEQWQVRELFGEGAIIGKLQKYALHLTEQGARRIT
jgi:hypothetical protein